MKEKTSPDKLNPDNFSSSKVPRVIFILLCDIVSINASAFLALYLLYDYDMKSVLSIPNVNEFHIIAPIYTVITVAVFFAMKLYNSLWAFAGFNEAVRIFFASVICALIQSVALFFGAIGVRRSYPVIYGFFLVFFTLLIRFSYRVLRNLRNTRKRNTTYRTMIIGAGQAGSLLLRELQTNKNSSNKVVCLIDDNPSKIGQYLGGVRIVGDRNSIASNVKKYNVDEIIMAVPGISPSSRREVIEICQKSECKLRTLPALYQLANGDIDIQQIRNVDVEDLLGRDSVNVDMDEISAYVSGKTVLVTGGGGSIGSELCRQIAKHTPKKLIIFDIYENNAYSIQQELKRRHPELKLDVLIGSVRDIERLDYLFRTEKPDIVYHAAAHKHVPLMEDSPCEAVKNNVVGTYNTALAAEKYGVQTFVMISTDKAVRPTNVMGATKRMCEMIIQMLSKHSKTRFVAVRFGNVLGSNGSVIPLFKKQIEEGGPVTVTHKNIIRYFMTIPEAAMLVLQAGAYAAGGEIYVLDMGDPVKIDDLARNMIKLSGFEPDVDIKIEYTGLRPGEKMYEELLLDEEGLTQTRNKLIYVGHPLVFDEVAFRASVEKFRSICSDDSDILRDEIKSIVPEFAVQSK